MRSTPWAWNWWSKRGSTAAAFRGDGSFVVTHRLCCECRRVRLRLPAATNSLTVTQGSAGGAGVCVCVCVSFILAVNLLDIDDVKFHWSLTLSINCRILTKSTLHISLTLWIHEQKEAIFTEEGEWKWEKTLKGLWVKKWLKSHWWFTETKRKVSIFFHLRSQ